MPGFGGGGTASGVAAALGVRTHLAGLVAFFVNADTGNDDAAGTTLATAWQTLDRVFEAYRYARWILGEEAMLTFNVAGAVFTWPEEWLEAANISFVGSDEDVVLASTAVSVSVESNVYNGGLLATFNPDPGLVPGAGRDGTFIVDVAGLVDPRPVAEFVGTAVVRYGGNNANTITLVTPNGLPQPCRMFTHGTTINLVGFGSSNRLIWDNVRFEKLDIGPDGESLRPSNGNVEFLECSVRANYLVEEDRVTVNRTWFRPGGFSQLGFFSFLGAVIDGAGSSQIIFNRGKVTQFKNMVVFVEPPVLRWEGLSGFYTSGDEITIQITEHPGLLPQPARKGPGTVMSLDNVRLLIEMSGVNTVWLDGDNQLLGGYNAGSEIKVQGGGTDAVVTGMLRDTIIQASAPTVTDDDANGFSAGNQVIDTAAKDVYICVDSSTGAAVWKKTTP